MDNCENPGSYKKAYSELILFSSDTNKSLFKNEVKPIEKSKTNPENIGQPKKKPKKSLEENKTSTDREPDQKKKISEYEEKISELTKTIENSERLKKKHIKDKRKKKKELSKELEAEKQKVKQLSNKLNELEAEKQRVNQLSDELEAEKQKVYQLSNKLEAEKLKLNQLSNKLDELEAEKQKVNQLSNKLDELEAEKQKVNQLSNKLEADKQKVNQLSNELEACQQKLGEPKLDVSENCKTNIFLMEYALQNPKKNPIRLSELIKVKQIKDVQGAFGHLYLFVDKVSKSKKYAIKTIPIEKKTKAQIKNEIKIWEKLQKCEKKPKSIPNFHGYEPEEITTLTDKKIQYNLIFDYFPSSLKKYIDELKANEQNFPLKKLLNFSKSLIDTLAYLQTLKVCHRDIKPANLLLDENSENIFVIDFGESKEIENYAETTLTRLAGTPKYLSPELHKIMQSNSEERKMKKLGKLDFYKSDVFSLGLVLLEMGALSVPKRSDDDEEAYFEKINSKIEKIHENYEEIAKVEELEEELEGFEGILRECLRIIPNERPDFISLFLLWIEKFEKEKDEKIQKLIMLSENN